MQRGALVLALWTSFVLGGCKDKKKSAPSQGTAQVSADGTGSGPTGVVVPPKPPGPPPPTAPDTTYEERRRLLLERGNPELMKEQPVLQTTAPDVKPEELIKQLGPDLLQIGKNIKLDLAKGRIEIPAKVAALTGPLEYVATAPSGKAYEALFTIDVSSIELRLAMSLLGYEGTVPTGTGGEVPAPTAEDSVLLAAIVNGKERPIGAYMIDKKTKKPPKDHPYQVIGFQDANRDTSLLTKDFITLVARDAFAPLRIGVDPGNPFAGPDEGYTANGKALPPKGGDAVIVIKRGPDKPAPPTLPPDMLPGGMPGMPGMPGSMPPSPTTPRTTPTAPPAP